MKKITFLFLILLASCASIDVEPSYVQRTEEIIVTKLDQQTVQLEFNNPTGDVKLFRPAGSSDRRWLTSFDAKDTVFRHQYTFDFNIKYREVCYLIRYNSNAN